MKVYEIPINRSNTKGLNLKKKKLDAPVVDPKLWPNFSWAFTSADCIWPNQKLWPQVVNL